MKTSVRKLGEGGLQLFHPPLFAVQGWQFMHVLVLVRVVFVVNGTGTGAASEGPADVLLNVRRRRVRVQGHSDTRTSRWRAGTLSYCTSMACT